MRNRNQIFRSVATPRAWLSYQLMLIKMKNRLDAIVPIWPCPYAAPQLPMAMALLDRLVDLSTRVCCRSRPSADSTQTEKTESTWKRAENVSPGESKMAWLRIQPYLMSEECGLKHWIGRLPRMSYSTHELSSCPDTKRRPDGSTHTAATGDPCREPGTVAGVTVLTHPRVRKSQKRTVLSCKIGERNGKLEIGAESRARYVTLGAIVTCEPDTNIAPPQLYNVSMWPPWPLSAWNGVDVAQSVT